MSYSNVYKNIDERSIKESKILLKSGIWKKETPLESKIQSVEKWLQAMSSIYNVSVPRFIFSDCSSGYKLTGGGTYSGSFKEITLYKKFSIVTLFHEFRHHLQHSKGIQLKLYRNDIEEDARAWSVSLFKLAAPNSYQRAVERGTLKFS